MRRKRNLCSPEDRQKWWRFTCFGYGDHAKKWFI